MMDLFHNRCTNCGADRQVDTDSSGPQTSSDDRMTWCPVCSLEQHTPIPVQPISQSELEYQLRGLIANARTSGLDPRVIVRVLSEELGFAAEMAHIGHQFSVQVTDLGQNPNDVFIEHQPTQNQRSGFQSGRRERRSKRS